MQNRCINIHIAKTFQGVIKDPFGDFFVSEDESCITEEQFAMDPNAIDIYWEKKYVADLNRCPSFLMKLHNDILKAGKYLNVIRQCGKDIGLHTVSKNKVFQITNLL